MFLSKLNIISYHYDLNKFCNKWWGQWARQDCDVQRKGHTQAELLMRIVNGHIILLTIFYAVLRQANLILWNFTALQLWTIITSLNCCECPRRVRQGKCVAALSCIKPDQNWALTALPVQLGYMELLKKVDIGEKVEKNITIMGIRYNVRKLKVTKRTGNIYNSRHLSISTHCFWIVSKTYNF